VSAPAPRNRDFAAKLDDLRRRYLRPASGRPASTARGVHHLALICSDPAHTIEFYQGLLGFPLVEVFENRDYADSTHFFFDIGNGNLLAFFDFPGLGLGRAEEAIGGVQHLAISVSAEQFDALRLRLEDAGVAYLGPDRGVEDSMYFRDPDGIQIELTSQPLRGGLEPA
jgi:glyoxylase I family protein